MAPNLLDVDDQRRAPAHPCVDDEAGLGVRVLDRITGKPIWPMPETPVLQSEVPGEQTSATQPIPSKPAPYAQQGLVESDLIDYTPAIKDSALKLAKRCRMGPYFIPASPSDGKGANGPAQYTCSWYAPGAAGRRGTSTAAPLADPETGMISCWRAERRAAVRGAEGSLLRTFRYTQPHASSCGILGAAPPPPGYVANPDAGAGGRGGRGAGGGGGGRGGLPMIGGVSIVKPKAMGGVTAYNLNTGDKACVDSRWRADARRDAAAIRSLLAVTLPPVPGGQWTGAGDHDEDVDDLWHRPRRRAAMRTSRRSALPTSRRSCSRSTRRPASRLGAVSIPKPDCWHGYHSDPDHRRPDGHSCSRESNTSSSQSGRGSSTGLVALTLPK